VLRKFVLVSIVVVGLAAILVTVAPFRLGVFRQELKSCFTDVQGLKPGAEVRIAGVSVGHVRFVRSNPQDKNCPAEITMDLATDYNIRVPRDAVAEIETAGLLGTSFVSIDVSQASGSPIEDYGYLKSKATKPPLTIEQTLRAINALGELVAAEKMREATPGKVNTQAKTPRP
jgi:phospholipid/cholesterol/gamma-HCH transport system substrate-binding protein